MSNTYGVFNLAPLRGSSCVWRDLLGVMLWDLTGAGARVAVICTATAAASQAHETRNTLVFGTRAKKVPLFLKPTQSLCVPLYSFADTISQYQQACM